MEELTGEVEDLTSDLIAAKLGQAELANAGLTLSHEKRMLEKQIKVESVEVHEIDYMSREGARASSIATTNFGANLGPPPPRKSPAAKASKGLKGRTSTP